MLETLVVGKGYRDKVKGNTVSLNICWGRGTFSTGSSSESLLFSAGLGGEGMAGEWWFTYRPSHMAPTVAASAFPLAR